MAPSEGGTGNPTGRGRRNSVSDLGMKLRESWLGRNWQTALIIVLVVLLAFFVRSYFAYSTSVDNGYLVSGGSDSYYHQRAIEYAQSTGDHLFQDPMLNYPFGMRNPRLPLYDWSVAVSGELVSGITGASLADSTGLSLVLSTAVWGSLTCIPVFMIGKVAFGRKAGLAAAFLFALLPGHIERSVLSNADHDAMILFFAVFGFYFMLMSLKMIKGDKWVANWLDFKSIRAGLSSYFKLNKLSMVYAALGGASLAAVMFIWEGFVYLYIIIFIYFLVQLLINCFRKVDSMGVLVSIAVMTLLATLLAFPMYYQLIMIGIWFDVPIIILAGVLLVGIIFVVTRDYPWTLVLPAFVIFAVVVLAGLAVLAPNLFEAVITGQGYLVKSKLYSTISEAQAPVFSNLALSFGAVTFWLAFIGLVWAAIKIPKNTSPYFIFMVVWTGAAMFMAISAGRFVFNASPAFAIAAGWILVLVIELLRFQQVPRGLAGFRWKNPVSSLAKGIKVRHVLGVVFLAFMIVLPNVWTAVDAGIPSETKRGYDLQVYNAVPDFLRPPASVGYDAQNGSYWYFGAFSYSLPLPNDYFPAGWRWFSQKDSNIQPEISRPAFLSWWDYGFEAIQEGKHPTVADNFQNSFQFAGSFITAPSEEQGVAMLITRCLEKADLTTGSLAYDALLAHGENAVVVRDILLHPGNYISIIHTNPEIYGPFDSELSTKNAKYVAARVELAKIGIENLPALYNDLRAITGVNVGYFMVDSRLFPFSATGSNIFYAPAKLSDRYIDPASNAPSDFYQIVAIDDAGNSIDIQNITSSTNIVSYEIIYKELFYQCLLYKAFMGYGPSDLGETSQGIPGFSGSLASIPPAQAWNMSNFRLVYKTAYYNPFPDYANHSDAWQAISYEEAVSLNAKINAGEAMGVVDLSPQSLARGMVFIQYYDGVIIEGTAKTPSGYPYANAYVTVVDENNIPHQLVKTDAHGYYKVIAPFGKVKVVFSTGELDKRTLLGAAQVDTVNYNFTYDQAMRVPVDSNGDGVLDYLINGGITIKSPSVSGKVFWDIAGDGTFSATKDAPIANATVVLENTSIGFKVSSATNSDGTYVITGIPPITGTISIIVNGHAALQQNIQVQPLANRIFDIGAKPASIGGTVNFANSTAATDIPVNLRDLANGNVTTLKTDSIGNFTFSLLLPGEYVVESGVGDLSFGVAEFHIIQAEKVTRTFVLQPAFRIAGQVLTPSGTTTANATIGITNTLNQFWTRAGADGRYSVTVPSGNYTMTVMAAINSKDYIYLNLVTGTTGTLSLNPTLSDSNYVSGQLIGGVASGTPVIAQSRSTEAKVTALVNSTGAFNMQLPNDLYFFYVNGLSLAYWNDMFISGNLRLVLTLQSSVTISGTAWYDANRNSVLDQSEGKSGVLVNVTDNNGRIISTATDTSGRYEVVLLPQKIYTMSVNQKGYGMFSETFSPLTSSVLRNVQLLALNRTFSAIVSYGAAHLASITVNFTAVSMDAVTTSAISELGGMVIVALHPGVYDVTVDQNVSIGSNATRYQFTQRINVAIAADPAPLGIDLKERFLVTLTVDPDRSTVMTITFRGPEKVEVKVQTSFTTYLLEGTYSVYAFGERLASRWAALFTADVGPLSNTVTITTEQAFQVRGVLLYDGQDLRKVVTVDITKSTGGTLELSSTTVGSFVTYLPLDSYNLTADLRTRQSVNALDRYVRYTGTQAFTITAPREVQVTLTRALDNSTITGTITYAGAQVLADLEFVPTSQTALALNASASLSDYSVTLAPGNYSLYAHQIGGAGVFMGKVIVQPYITNHLNLTLQTGALISGNALINGIPAQAHIEFTSANFKALDTNAAGVFEVYLPPDTYAIKATASGTERGVSVDYKLTQTSSLTISQNLNLALTKVPKHQVGVTWDPNEKQTVAPGTSVVYNIHVTNKGNVADTYKLTATLPAGWTGSFSNSLVDVDFGTANSQLVTLTISTPADAKVTHATTTIRAVSTSGSVATNTVSVDVGILPVHDVSLTYTKALPTTGQSYNFTVALKNTGNIDDMYAVSLVNLAELNGFGWKAEIMSGSGAFASNLTVAVGAGNSNDLTLRLTPIRANPEPSIQVVISATSQSSTTTNTVLAFNPDLPKLSIQGGFSVSGEGVTNSVPSIPVGTVVLAALVLAMITILILVSIQKGVFRRGKR